MPAQVANETAALELAKMIRAYEDSNPEVGFGVTWGICLDQAIERLGLRKTDLDYDVVLGELKILNW